MKYEKLNVVSAKRTKWPENEVVDFEAYDAKSVDEAIAEIMNWYAGAKDLSEKLAKELSAKEGELAKALDDKSKFESDAKVAAIQAKMEMEGLSSKAASLERQLDESHKALANSDAQMKEYDARVVKMQNDYIAMSNRVDASTIQNGKLQSDVGEMREENGKLMEDIAALKMENKRLSDDRDKTAKRLAEAEKALKSVTELVSYYEEWKKKDV